VEKVQASLSASSKTELKRFRSSILSSISFHAIKESSSSSSPFQYTSSFAFQINLILVVDFDRNEIHRIPGLNRAFNCSYQFIRCRNFNHARVRNGNLDLISKFQVDLRYWCWKVVSFSYLIILWIASECEKCILCLLILLSFDFYEAHTRIQTLTRRHR